MQIIDFTIVGIIFFIVAYYALIRFKEEKRKKEQQLIPTLEYYKDKFSREREDYRLRADEYRDRLNQLKRQLENLKEDMSKYPWTDSQVRYLKQMKGSEFEYFLNTTFKMLGFEVIDPEYYREFNIDSILKIEIDGKLDYIIVDYIDFTAVKKVNRTYLEELKKGTKKYNISKVWIITNGYIDEEIKDMIFQFDYNLFDVGYITKFLPSLNFFYEYEDLKSKFHATEILHKEMFDEIIRREHWLQEVEEKLIEVLEKRNKL